MTTAREIMTADPEFVREGDTLVDAARKMAEFGVGALPVCGDDGRLTGMVTDRDIVVSCIARGGDPATTTAGSLTRGAPVTVGADDPVEEALATMSSNQVRRLPVVDGHDLVGMLSQADVARAMPDAKTGDLVAAISV